ncbi:unnamed protein product [Urochloa decumbens]|uniref:Uncharacterized protein n=1 Tax=Urochloa decumbens TaxID=240449 RepID=A0ABC8YT52_9POAL
MDRESEVVLVVCGEGCDAAPIFDINTGEEILRIHDCRAPPSGLACVAGCLLAASRPDKDQLVFGGAIYFWDINKLQETNKSCLGEAIGPIACSKDGIYLVGGTHSGNAYIWEVASGSLLKSWRAHKNALTCLAFSQDSSLIISGSEEGTVHVWCMISLFQVEEPQAHEAVKHYPDFYNTIEHEASITGILTILGGPCPMLITSSPDSSCKVSELLSGRLRMLTLFSPITTTDIDPLEQLMICGAIDAAKYVTGLNGTGMQYTTKMLSQDDCQVLCGHNAPISALAFCSEGAWLVSGSKDCTVVIWDIATWNVVRKLGNKMGEPVTNLLVMPKPEGSRVDTRNYLSLEIPKLEKKSKLTNETPIILLPSGFPKDADSAHTCFQSAELLSKQISDLEGKRTPEVIQMAVAMTVHEQTKDQNTVKELSSMNSVVQCKVLKMMQLRASLD